MDSGSALIAAVLLAICIMPFAIMRISRIKKGKKMLNALTTIANDHNSQITHHECFGDFIIGMDKTKGFVFFYKQMKGETIEQFINLAEIRMCEVINGTRSVADHGGYFQIIDKLDLSFIPIAANRPPIVLNFYDAEDNLQLSGELQFIEKWAKRINDELQNKK